MPRVRAPWAAAAAIAVIVLGGAVALLLGAFEGSDEGGARNGDPILADPRDEGAPLVLLLHAGGFLLEDESSMSEAMTIADEAGFETAVVEYPLGDLQAAVAHVKKVARRAGRGGRKVYAYGESAGGTLAALLAERGLIRGAATYSPIADLVDFIAHTPDSTNYSALIQADRPLLRASSPAAYPSEEPIFAMTPELDSPYLNRETRMWDRRDEQVRSVVVDGGHVGYGDGPGVYTANAKRALGWLAKQAGLR